MFLLRPSAFVPRLLYPLSAATRVVFLIEIPVGHQDTLSLAAFFLPNAAVVMVFLVLP